MDSASRLVWQNYGFFSCQSNILDSFGKIMDSFLAKATSNTALYKPVLECLETLRFIQFPMLLYSFCKKKNFMLAQIHKFFIPRYLVSENQRKCSLSDDIQSVNFLIHVIARSHVDLISLYRPSGNQKSAIEMGKKITPIW